MRSQNKGRMGQIPGQSTVYLAGAQKQQRVALILESKTSVRYAEDYWEQTRDLGVFPKNTQKACV